FQRRTVRSPIADCPQSILLNYQRQHRLWTKPNLTGGLSAPPRRTVHDTQLLTRATGGSKCGGDGDGRSPAPATHHGRGKRLESTRNSPRIHSRGRFEWRTTGEADRRWSKDSSTSNG